MNKKIVIDTNVLYHSLNIFINNKINKDLFDKLMKSNEIYITTPSISEFIIRFQNHLSNLKKCIQPIMTEKIKIVSIGFVPIENQILSTIYNAKSLNEIQTIFKKVLQERIKTETDILFFFYLSLMTGFIHIQAREYIKKTNHDLDSQLEDLTILMFEKNNEKIKTLLKEHLELGYKNEDVDKKIKQFFSSKIIDFTKLWKILYYSNIEKIPAKEYFTENSKLKCYVNNDIHIKKMKRKKLNPLSYFSQTMYKKDITEYIDFLAKEMSGHRLITKETLGYIKYKINKCLSQKSLIEKNDVFDLLNIYSLHLENFFILTFDKDINKYLKEINNPSYNLYQALLCNKN